MLQVDFGHIEILRLLVGDDGIGYRIISGVCRIGDINTSKLDWSSLGSFFDRHLNTCMSGYERLEEVAPFLIDCITYIISPTPFGTAAGVTTFSSIS